MTDWARCFADETIAIEQRRIAEENTRQARIRAGIICCDGCIALDYDVSMCQEFRRDGICKLVLFKRYLDALTTSP